MTPSNEVDQTKKPTNCTTTEHFEKTDIANNNNGSIAHIDEQSLVHNSPIKSQRFSPLLRQILAVSGPFIASIAGGMTAGYSAVLLPELQKNTSTIRISLEEASWIASAAPLLMAFGCLIGGILIQRYGRRMAHFILNVPFVLGWVIITLSTSFEWIILGRFITGFCVGLLGPAAPIYIGEATAPQYRGLFLAGITLAVSSGIIIVHTVGWYFTWQTTAIICGFCPFLSYLIMGFVPESPSWLITQGRVDDALRAFKWLRGHDDAALKEFKSMVDAHKLSEADVSAVSVSSVFSWTKLKESFSTRIFLLPLITLFIFFVAMQGSGLNVIIFYSITILKQVFGDSLNEYLATLIIDIVRLIAALAACVLLRKCGRRPLLSISGIGTIVSLLALAIYIILAKQYEELKMYSWIPLGLLMFYVAIVSLGLNPLPWCMVGELFPTQYRALGSAIVTFTNFITVFTTVKTSPFLFANYGISGAFIIYAIITLLGTTYLMIFLPETKNRSLQEIEDEYRGKKTGADITSAA